MTPQKYERSAEVAKPKLSSDLPRGGGDLTHQHFAQAVVGRTVEDVAFVRAILAQALDFLVLDRARTVVDLDPVTFAPIWKEDTSKRFPIRFFMPESTLIYP